MKIVEFWHDDATDALPTYVDVWAKARGFSRPVRLRVDKGEAFLRPAAFDLLVLHGGPQHLWNKDAAPWLYGEVEYVRQLLAAGRPAVGFGMGAGILAQVLGAQVYHCGTREQGLLYIRPWNESLGHPLLRGLEKGFYSYMGHSDHYALPVRQSLAHTALSPHAMFAPDNVPAVGFQFHPEYTPELAQRHYGRLLDSPHRIELYPVFEQLMDHALDWFFTFPALRGSRFRSRA